MATAIDLTDRVAIVTGASSGIGAETARVMASHGARIVAVGRDVDRLQETVEGITASGGEATSIIADVGGEAGPAEIVRHAAELSGTIDVVVQTAGHFAHATLVETPMSQFDELWEVHVRGPFRLLQHAAPLLGEGSSVLFYSSTVTQAGFAPYAAYSAIKGAVESMSRSLAVELAPRTRVNTIAPGFTATATMHKQFATSPELEEAIVDRTPLGFLGGPKSAAHLAAYLASDCAEYVTGARLVVDGGWTAQAWQA